MPDQRREVDVEQSCPWDPRYGPVVGVVARDLSRYGSPAKRLFSSDGVDRTMMDLRRQPRAHATSRGVISPSASPDRHEHLLKDVFGRRPLTEHPERHPHRRGRVATVEVDESVLASVCDPGEEFAISAVVKIADVASGIRLEGADQNLLSRVPIHHSEPERA